LTEITALPQKIVNRKIVVLKSRLDPTMAKLLGEKIKGKFFVRLSFLKPKPEEIRLISVDKYYEPYIVIGGKYAVDYCKRSVHVIEVDKEMEEMVVAGKKFKPEPLSAERPSKVVELEGEEHFHYEDEAFFILDRMGREVDPEQTPYAPSEEQPESLTEIGLKLREVKISSEQEIEFLRSRIAIRPSDADEVTREWFEVNERTMICIPVYELTFQDIKTGKEVNVEIDGITGKIIRYGKKLA
jgi:hypothetical protein